MIPGGGRSRLGCGRYCWIESTASPSRGGHLGHHRRGAADALPRAVVLSRGQADGRAPDPGRARDVVGSAARIEYAAVVNATTLRPQHRLRGRVAVLLAVRIGRTRLIDNVLVDVS